MTSIMTIVATIWILVSVYRMWGTDAVCLAIGLGLFLLVLIDVAVEAVFEKLKEDEK